MDALAAAEVQWGGILRAGQMIFVWALVALAGLAGLWTLLGRRVTRRTNTLPPLTKVDLAMAIGAVCLAVVGLTLVILVGIDNATVERINCVQVVRPDTGEDELSCQETGGLDWLPTWITGGAKRVKR